MRTLILQRQCLVRKTELCLCFLSLAERNLFADITTYLGKPWDCSNNINLMQYHKQNHSGSVDLIRKTIWGQQRFYRWEVTDGKRGLPSPHFSSSYTVLLAVICNLLAEIFKIPVGFSHIFHWSVIGNKFKYHVFRKIKNIESIFSPHWSVV